MNSGQDFPGDEHGSPDAAANASGAAQGPYKLDLPGGQTTQNQARQDEYYPQWLDSGQNARVTNLLIAVNVFIFLAMVLTSGFQTFSNPASATLLAWGADYGPLTFTGEYWRVFSSMFVHGGIIHILMNMVVLWQSGPFVERLYGSSKYLTIYFLAGLCGSLCSLYFHPDIVSVGASGAIFGVYGALLAFFKAHAKHFPPDYLKSITGTVIFFLIYNLIWGAAQHGIDNAAHIGGFAGGFLAGLTVMPKNFQQTGWRLKDACLLALLIGLLILFAKFDYQAFTAHYLNFR